MREILSEGTSRGSKCVITVPVLLRAGIMCVKMAILVGNMAVYQHTGGQPQCLPRNLSVVSVQIMLLQQN